MYKALYGYKATRFGEGFVSSVANPYINGYH